jgi:hypothetical protein
MSASFPLADLIVRIVTDMSQFSREMVRAESLLKKKASAFSALEKQGNAVFTSIARAVGGFGAAITTAMTAALGTVAALIGGLTALSVWSVKVATGADELRNRFAITFGREAKRARAEIDQFADAAGRSRLELTDMAATLQNVFTAMGFSIQQAAGLSVTIAKLGTDIASFHDIADSDAVDRLSSALVGNHEALRSLGIVVTETAVKQELLAMGFRGGFDSANDQQKMLARLNIILRSTNLMHNDAIRTSGSAANQFKGLWGAIKDLADIWGQALLPAVKVVLGAMRDAALAARDNATSFTALSTMLAGWATNVVTIFQELMFVIGNYDLSWKALVMTIQQAIEPIQTTISSFAVAAFAALEWLGTNWQTVWKNTLESMGNLLHGFVSDVTYNLKGLWDFIATKGQTFSFKNTGIADAVDLTKGTTDFTVPEIDKTDWDSKWKELEDDFNRRREGLTKGKAIDIKEFVPPDLQGLFDTLAHNPKAEIKVSMTDSLSAFRENLLDAFNNTEAKKQTQLQQDLVNNQRKQIDAEAQQHSETLRALGHVGGGFF